MPPKGESIGFALEDAIVIGSVVSHLGANAPPASIFVCQDKIRRGTLDAAYKDAAFGWKTNKDNGVLVTKIMEWMTPFYLWMTKESRAKTFSTDPRDIQFPS
jgi:hypothetical protein